MENKPDSDKFIRELWTYSSIMATMTAMGSDVRWAAISLYNSENQDMINAFAWVSVQALFLLVIASMHPPDDPDNYADSNS